MADTWTILKLITWTSDYFAKKAIDSPRLTSELLLAHVLQRSRVKLYMQFDQPVQKEELATFRALIERRIGGEPTAYLLGSRDFYGRTFKVDSRVLVPRPETERLVERVLRELPPESTARVLDLCTGTCCIAATVAAERPQVRVMASDLSIDALAVARENLHALGLERVELVHGDLFAPMGDAKFEIIVSNPPYIAEGAPLPNEVLREPKMALRSGADGLDALRKIIAQAPTHLTPNGLLALEIGDDQGTLVRDLLMDARYREITIEPDWAGKDRIASARAPE